MAWFTREQWGSQYPRGGHVIAGPVGEFYVHHSAGAVHRSPAAAMEQIRDYQRMHVVRNGWADLGYSWVVDDAGNVYEGRGWFRTGAHTENWNSKGYGVCWLGNSEIYRPSNDAIAGFAAVYREGVRVGALRPDATIVGHRDRVSTACPGGELQRTLPALRLAVAGQPSQPPPKDPEDVTPELRAELDRLRQEQGAWLVALTNRLAALESHFGPLVEVYPTGPGHDANRGQWRTGTLTNGACSRGGMAVPLLVGLVYEAATSTREGAALAEALARHNPGSGKLDYEALVRALLRAVAA